MKQIYATSNEIDLQMLVGLLESQGINSQVSAEGAGDYFRKLGSDYAITKRVLVSEQDWDKAVQIADENGFRNSNISRKGNTEVIVARIVLVIIVILFIIFILNMTGCSNEKTNTVSETEPINPTTEILTETETVTTSVVTETSTECNTIEDKKILNVLENKEKYFNTEFQEYCYLKDYSSTNYMTCNDEDRYEYVSSDVDLDENLKMEQWCEVDIDSNGNKEVLIELSNGNILVLHSDDDRIYSYVFPFRGMKEIKLDGSFESSGSAANTYIGKVKFVNGECFYDEICAIDETDEKKPIYRIDKKDTNREKVESYLNQQKEKEAVLWITDMIEE